MKSTTVLRVLCLSYVLGDFWVMSACAGFFDVETKMTASDAYSSDQFGFSVGVSGNIAIVGSRYDDDAGSHSGSAYLYDVTSGNQLAKLTANDAAGGGQFGHSVAISGDIAIIGTPNDDNGGAFSGSAYLFDVTTGNQLAKLTADDAALGDQFGSSVAISGNFAIIGAEGDDDSAGSAYLFDVTTGSQVAKLTASDAAANDNFGQFVGISGNTAVVGADGKDDVGDNSGSAYLFDVTTGNQIAKLTANDASANDSFGYSVAISGNTAIVGARYDDDGGGDSGSAYLFDVTTGNQIGKLTANDAAVNDRFGFSVAIDGNIALVGAYADDDGGSLSGSAYLFDITTGSQLAKLTAFDAAATDFFSYSVAISGNTAVVGAPRNSNLNINSGAAYLFQNVVPEPTSIVLTSLASTALLFLRRR